MFSGLEFLTIIFSLLSFSCFQICFLNSDGTENLHPTPPFRIRFPKNLKGNIHVLPGYERSTVSSISEASIPDDHSDKAKLLVEAYVPPDPGPYPQDQPKQNSVPFTPTQVHGTLTIEFGILVKGSFSLPFS